MNRRGKIYLVIGSSNFLLRLGVKTILNVIGREVELIEAADLSTFKSYLKDVDLKYFVLSNDLFVANEMDDLETFNVLYEDKQLMLITDDAIDDTLGIPVLSPSADQNTVVKCFQQFFAKDESKKKKDDNVLTEREMDVLRHVALGLSNKEMADKLFISANTVITHRKNITDKLGIKTIPGLTVYAIMNNLITPDEVKY